MQRKRQQGMVAVEFAAVGVVFFTILLGAFEAGLVMGNREYLENAAMQGAKVLASKRGYTNPWSTTRTAIQNKLPGSLASTVITLDIVIPCVGSCSCPSGYSASNNLCVSTCTSDSACATVLSAGLDTDNPVIKDGRMARVTLVYAYSRISSYFSNLTSLNAVISEPVQ